MYNIEKYYRFSSVCYSTNFEYKGDFTMWVITVFEKDTFRMFEYSTKDEATMALKTFKQTALLSYTK